MSIYSACIIVHVASLSVFIVIFLLFSVAYASRLQWQLKAFSQFWGKLIIFYNSKEFAYQVCIFWEGGPSAKLELSR